MFLGGSHFQLAPIHYAKSKGYYTILCDYLTDNPGKNFADEYHPVSTTDKEAILTLAMKLKLDAVIAYASDPAAHTAAYVAMALDLPGNPYYPTHVLTHKDLYRDFLERNGFNTPKAAGFFSARYATRFAETCSFPVVVKPTDSSGSKGVTVCHNLSDIGPAFERALEFSREERVIVEEFIERKGYQVAGDGFVVDGKLVFRCFGNEHFNEGGVVPIGESFPSILPDETQQRIHDEIQRLIDCAGLRIGALNFDIILDKNDKIYLMEVGPRNGGNLIPEAIKYATGVDLVKYTVDAALGMDCSDLKMAPVTGAWATYILHSDRNGILKMVYPSLGYKDFDQFYGIMELKKPGDKIEKFSGSNESIAAMIISSGSIESIMDRIEEKNSFGRVVLTDDAFYENGEVWKDGAPLEPIS